MSLLKCQSWKLFSVSRGCNVTLKQNCIYVSSGSFAGNPWSSPHCVTWEELIHKWACQNRKQGASFSCHWSQEIDQQLLILPLSHNRAHPDGRQLRGQASKGFWLRISLEPEGTAGNLSSSAAKTHLLVAELGAIVSVSKRQLFESLQEGKGWPRISLWEDGSVSGHLEIGRLLTIASTSESL